MIADRAPGFFAICQSVRTGKEAAEQSSGSGSRCAIHSAGMVESAHDMATIPPTMARIVSSPPDDVLCSSLTSWCIERSFAGAAYGNGVNSGFTPAGSGYRSTFSSIDAI